MPDPWLYLTAIAAAALGSALVVWLGTHLGSSGGSARAKLAIVAGLTTGLILGFLVLGLRIRCPPANGLDRFLILILPAALGIEWLATVERLPGWLGWALRLGLIAVAPRILLHGSVYVSELGNRWNPAQLAATMAVSIAFAAGLLLLLTWLSQRTPGVSAPLGLALSILAAGLTIMLAGYVTGGAAALPPAATMSSVAIVAALAKLPGNSVAPVYMGVVCLSGFLFIGRYFGGLATGPTLTIFGASLLAWLVEIPSLRPKRPWVATVLRLTLVAIPLLAVVMVAKRHFDRHTAPLLVEQGVTTSAPRRHGGVEPRPVPDACLWPRPAEKSWR